MTVNELIQKLIELARDGKGQYPIKLYQPDRMYSDYEEVGDIYVAEDLKEVVIDYYSEGE